eukprot:Lithocolla_globosa_v1_NODE_3172_length_1741_cov_62.406287.p4 type:complete len:110 gc:universal NODE_3172_length_1741_cov_62.406287:1306-977(-)
MILVFQIKFLIQYYSRSLYIFMLDYIKFLIAYSLSFSSTHLRWFNDCLCLVIPSFRTDDPHSHNFFCFLCSLMLSLLFSRYNLSISALCSFVFSRYNFLFSYWSSLVFS